jgi:hypothetical protein
VDPTSGIRKHGFRKWYERQLIECHAALVTCLLCGVTFAAMIEVVNLRDFGWRTASLVGTMFAAGALGWYSWRHYITVLTRAEFYGERSTCPECKTYGRFEILSTGVDELPGRTASAVAPLEAAWIRVQCRQCGTAWRMPE